MPRVVRSCVAWMTAGVLLIESGSSALAAESPEAAAFFESKIRPVLVQHCYQCHSAKAGKSEGGLRLDSRHGIRAGGDRGAAVVPGDSKKSVLLTAISHTDPDLKMPPKKERLPESVINDFKTWINSGAADPREEDAANAAAPPVTIEAGRNFWAYQKPTTHTAPTTKTADWAKQHNVPLICNEFPAVGMSMVPSATPSVRLRLVFVCGPMSRSIPPLMVKFDAAIVDAPMELGTPPSLRLFTASTPPLIVTGPVKSLVVLIVSVPVPDFTSPPAPLSQPLPVRV